MMGQVVSEAGVLSNVRPSRGAEMTGGKKEVSHSKKNYMI